MQIGMMKAPLPEKETERLEALHKCKILDTAPEEAFENITRLAAYICSTPIALVSLVDAERQWFKSKVGIDATQVPRDVGFCAHAILQTDVLIVPDTLADRRFATNPLVTSAPYIRFYAGVPLIAASGHALGTVCVIDYVPRELDAQQIEALRTLGDQVVREIDLRRNLSDLQRTAVERKQAQKGRSRFFTKIAAGFGLASVLLAGIGLVSYQSMTSLIESSNQAASTQKVLGELEDVVSQMKDAETGQRGYLLTGKERYLESYRTAIKAVEQDIKELRKLTADNPNQQRRLNTLERLSAEKLAELKQTIDLRRNKGFEAALQVVLTDKGKNLMDEIRSVSRESENEQKELLKQRSAAASLRTRNTIFTFSSGIFLNFFILAVVYHFIRREIGERKRTEVALEKERDFTCAVIDTSGALVVVLDSQGRIVRFNRACEQTTGYSFAEVRGKHFWDLFLIAEEMEQVRSVFENLQGGQFENCHENYWVTRSGDRRLITWSNTLLCDMVDAVEYVISTGIDITERKQMEQVLRESEEIFQTFMNNSPAVAFMKDEQGRFVYVNEPFERYFNIKLANLLGKTDFDVWPSEIALQFRENDTRVLTGDKTVEIVETVPAPDGYLRHWLSFKFPCKDISGRRLLGGVAVDITERQQAESELLESQTRLLLINSISTGITSGMSVEQVIERTLERISGYFNTLRVAYSTVDQQGNLTVLYSIEPPGMAQLKGKVADLNVAPEYLNAMLRSESVIVEDVATDSRLTPLADAMLSGGNRAVLDVPLQHSEQLVGLLCFDSPVPRKWSEHEIVTLREVADYLAVAIKEANAQLERKHAEEALKESEERFRWMADGAPVLLWMTDYDGAYTYVNKPWLDFTGRTLDAELGMGWTDGVPPEDLERCSAIFRQAFTAREYVQMEHRLRHNDGQYRWLLVSGTPRFIGETFAGYIGSCVDITDRKIQEAELSQANEKLKSWVNELEQRNREIALLSKMSDFLQACLTVEEAYAAISQLVQPLFPQTNGGIYLISASKNLVETVATWGSPFPSQELFTPHECWALRRGRAHWVDDAHSGFVCKHRQWGEMPTESLCVPMMAQGEAIGVLYLSSQELGRLTEPKQQLATTVAEHIALALANLKLRSTLQNQSIRDPLTGLFNRRYMEESLEREMHRCDRKQQPLSIIMLDVDHFKRFNDTFGHDAGDTVLRELGLFLQKHIRKSDIACRYGGEELTLILPESSLEVVQQRAEQIREGAKHLNVYHERQPLGAIALSLGVACFPEHGSTGEAVLRAADAALYRAKKSGRDQVVSASSSTSAASNIDCAR